MARVALVDAAPLAALAVALDLEAIADGGVRLGAIDGVPVAMVPRGAEGVRAARALGAEILLFAVRARPLRSAPATVVGAISDHIGLFVPNPLIGPNQDDVGPRFPDLSDLYASSLRELARRQASVLELSFSEGVYGALPDPSRGTAEQYRMLGLTADWVGQGGVAEGIVARHAGMRVLGLVALDDGGGVTALARELLPRL